MRPKRGMSPPVILQAQVTTSGHFFFAVVGKVGNPTITSLNSQTVTTGGLPCSISTSFTHTIT